MARAVTKGDTYELRMARLLFVEGAFVRRAIDLNMRFGEDLTVTDLDILALTFSMDFRASLTIGESKSGQGRKGSKFADRLLWLRGLQNLVGADFAFIATAKRASDRVRGLAERLDVQVIDEQDLIHRERINNLDENSAWGPYDPSLLDRQREVYDAVKKDQDLKRVYWFIRSEFWLLDVTTGVKRAFGAMRVLAKLWRGRPSNDQQESLQWLARHVHVNIVVGLVRLASRSYREEPAKSADRLLRELASGPDLDFEVLARISQEVDHYVTAVLGEMGADPGKHASALGAFHPTPPGYAESLVEVVERLAAAPEAATELPRIADVRLAEFELKEQLSGLRIRQDLIPECDRLLRLVTAFIEGQLKIPPELLSGAFDTRISSEKGSNRGHNKSGSHNEETADRLFNEATAPLKPQ